MRFVSDEEWARATAVPVTTAREISEAERQEAVQLSTAIARITRSVTATDGAPGIPSGEVHRFAGVRH